MSTRPLGESNTVIRLRTSLENLRSVLVNLEALAHAARETLDRLPFMPLPPDPTSEGPERESRLNYGRLQALVTATASSAKEVLLVCSEMVESSYEPPVTMDDEDDEGSGSGGAGTPGSSRNGEPDASGSGNVPQAQAITDAEPTVLAPARSRRPGRNWSRSASMTSTMDRASHQAAPAAACRQQSTSHRRAGVGPASCWIRRPCRPV